MKTGGNRLEVRQVPLEKSVEHLTGNCHDSEGVLKTAVLSAWVHVVGKTDLTDSPEALEERRIDYSQLAPRKPVGAPKAMGVLVFPRRNRESGPGGGRRGTRQL